MRRKILSILLFVCGVGQTAASQSEVLHPSGYSFECWYSLSTTNLELGDTLIISRAIVNAESFDLFNLYFSDNLPGEFQIVAEALEVGGVAIPISPFAPLPDGVVTGWFLHYWVVDSPDSGEQIHNPINSGDTVRLEVKIVPSDIGEFILPFHTTVFSSNNLSFFATAPPDTVLVRLAADVEEHPDGLAPDHYELTTGAYPNPFNGTAQIYFWGTRLSGQPLTLTVYNALGQLVYSRTVRPESDRGVIRWPTSPLLGSGIYLYRLAGDHVEDKGKVVLLK